jgi:hypothetical protein
MENRTELLQGTGSPECMPGHFKSAKRLTNTEVWCLISKKCLTMRKPSPRDQC